MDKIFQMHKSQCRKRKTMKNQITNPIIIEPNENDLEELPDKRFKRKILIYSNDTRKS